MHYLTFVTPKPQIDFDLNIQKSYPNIGIENRVVLDERAVRWHIENPLDKKVIDLIRQKFCVDVFQTDGAPIKLFMADMDSTIVSGETLDDMADLVGIGDKVAEITARAMRGELNFESAIDERVGLLKGMSTDIIDTALSEMKINDGARELLAHLKSNNVYCVLISGGFTQFTSAVADDLGFDANFGNELIIDNNTLTGTVKRPILDKNFKLQKLKDLKSFMNLKTENIMAIGDGANDLPMLSSAGHGISYHGKPLLKDSLVNQIHYTDLSSLIYVIEPHNISS